MKGESARRVIVIMLCLFVVVVACLGVSAGTAKDVEAAQTSFSVLFPTSLFIPVFSPNVTDVDPNGGLITGGEEVVITGTGFTGATEVTFGGTPATSFTVDSDTQITAIAPMHAPGNVQVMVIEGTWESPDTSADDYTYVEPPPTTAAPTTEPPTTAAPTTEPPTTAAPATETTMMVTTTVAAVEGEGGGLSGGWIAFIVVIAAAVVGGMGVFVYRLGKGSK